MDQKTLTDQQYWEEHWRSRKASGEVKKGKKGSFINEILKVFDTYLPVNENHDVLEVGGAPGRYLIYVARNFKYQTHSLDYSTVGNEKTQANFARVGLPVTVHDKDFFAENLSEEMPRFDVVYSLGFVEHFEDLTDVVRRHVLLLKPQGLLLLGVPNLSGVYSLFLRHTAPSLLAGHNLKTMDAGNWQEFEEELQLVPLFRGYVGGFDTTMLKKLETGNLKARMIHLFVKILRLFNPLFRRIRKCNSRLWSGYLMGVYRKGP